jgi:CPA2 family monovalent cation:H+ antiporter-2
MVEIARILNPRIGTVLRTHSDEEAELLRQEGLGEVFMGEHELALAMTRYVLDQAGVDRPVENPTGF